MVLKVEKNHIYCKGGHIIGLTSETGSRDLPSTLGEQGWVILNVISLPVSIPLVFDSNREDNRDKNRKYKKNAFIIHSDDIRGVHLANLPVLLLSWQEGRD